MKYLNSIICVLVCLNHLNISSCTKPNSIASLIKSRFNSLSTKIVIPFLSSTLIPLVSNSNAADLIDINSDQQLLELDKYKKSLFNIPPNFFQYPAYFEGSWTADYTFKDAQFTKAIPFQQLSRDVNVAGFRKYSILQFPDVGANYKNVTLSYKRDGQSKNTIVADVISNLQNQFLVGATTATNKPVIDGIEYNGNQNPNRVSLNFRDSTSFGRLELFTNSRTSTPVDPSQQTQLSPSFRTIEFLRQSTSRQKIGERPSQLICDYAIEYIFQPIISSQAMDSDNVNNNDKLNTVNKMVGKCRVFSYIIPQDDFYFQLPDNSLPVCAFTYGFLMTK